MSSIESIQSVHNDKMKEFEKDIFEITSFRKDICKKEVIIQSLDDSISNIMVKNRIQSEILELELQIEQIEQKRKQNEYYLNVANILYEYENNNQLYSSKKEKKNANPNNPDISLFVNRSLGKQNKQFYESYINIVTKNTNSSIESMKEYFCNECNIPKSLIPNESILVCTSCGSVETFLDNNQNSTTYEQEIHTESNINHGIYKRMSHFNDILSNCQGKTNISIPQELIDNINLEIKKQKIDINSVSHKKIKSILKKLKASKFYDQGQKILNIISNKDLLHIPQTIEHSLKTMFRKIQEPFEKHKPKSRSNFLSYSYCFYQLLKILNETKYSVLFPLLKSKEKLREQDKIWKKICDELGWQFHPAPIF